LHLLASFPEFKIFPKNDGDRERLPLLQGIQRAQEIGYTTLKKQIFPLENPPISGILKRLQNVSKNMNKTAIFIVALLMLSPAAANANLITNPGFETGNFSGWSPYAYGSEQVSSANPNSGQYEARIYNYGWITQTVNVTPDTSYKLSSYLYMPQDGGEASISITFYNSSGTSSFQQERTWERIPGSQQYEKIETDWLVAPSYTAYAKVKCSVASAGSYIDFDDVNLEVIPEPASILLLLSGLTGLFGLGLKKKS
jgi:hypothetical protein